MAEFITHINGNLNRFANHLKTSIMHGSASASLEHEFETKIDNVCCCVQIYERYSIVGGNRVSLNVTLLSSDDKIQVIAFTSGGSQAMFFKLNTFGEEAFLDCLKEAIENFN